MGRGCPNISTDSYSAALHELPRWYYSILSPCTAARHLRGFWRHYAPCNAFYVRTVLAYCTALLGADVKALADQCDLMLELMVNHISPASPQFQDYLEKGDASEFAPMFIDWAKFWPPSARPQPSAVVILSALLAGEAQQTIGVHSTLD